MSRLRTTLLASATLATLSGCAGAAAEPAEGFETGPCVEDLCFDGLECVSDLCVDGSVGTSGADTWGDDDGGSTLPSTASGGTSGGSADDSAGDTTGNPTTTTDGTTTGDPSTTTNADTSSSGGDTNTTTAGSTSTTGNDPDPYGSCPNDVCEHPDSVCLVGTMGQTFNVCGHTCVTPLIDTAECPDGEGGNALPSCLMVDINMNYCLLVCGYNGDSYSCPAGMECVPANENGDISLCAWA